MEKVKKRVAEALCLKRNLNVYGFDSGIGLPKPPVVRDLPNLFSEGFFPMDANKLRARLDKAQLMLGPHTKILLQNSLILTRDSDWLFCPTIWICILQRNMRFAFSTQMKSSFLPRVYLFFRRYQDCIQRVHR